MATFESINRLWLIASSLQDQAMAEIRDGKQGMAPESIADLEKALAEMSALQRQACLLNPRLKPESPGQPYECSEADRLLLASMYDAAQSERAGNTERAIETLKGFLARESSPWHQEMAAEELERLQGSAST